MIAVAKDLAGVRQAAIELLKEPMISAQIEKTRRQAEGAANKDRILEGLPLLHPMASGYYVRAAYGFWLDSSLDLVPASPGALTADDLELLRVVNQARDEFRRDHEQCPRCAHWLERGGVVCDHCGHQFQRGDQCQ